MGPRDACSTVEVLRGAACLAALLLAVRPAPAQSVRSFDSSDQGLPSARVLGGVQLRDGRVAFAGDVGLAVHDGRGWNIDARPLGQVARPRFLALDARGRIRLCGHDSREPLLLLEDDRWLSMDLPADAAAGDGERIAFGILNGADGEAVWVAAHGGTSLFSNGAWRDVATRGDLGGSLRAAALYGGGLALGGEGGLALWRDGALDRSFQEAAARAGLARETVLALTVEQASPSTLWILGASWIARANGVDFVVLERGSFELDAESAHCALPDGTGGLWIGSRVSLWHHEAGEGGLRRVRRDARLETWPGVSSLLRDREDVLWVGHDRGVHRIPSARFENWTRLDGLLEDDVTAVVESPPGRLVLAHPEGLTFLEHGRATTRRLQNDVLQANRILSMDADSQGGLWIARSRGGALRVAPDGGIRTLELPAQAFASSVLVDRSGTVWLSTFEHVYRVEGERLVDVHDADVCGGGPRRLVELADGRLALATAFCGAALLEQGRWRSFEHPPGRSANSTYDLCLRADGTLLVAADAGLLEARDGVLAPWSEGGFALEEPVYALLEVAGELWAGTRDGVVRWDGRHAVRYGYAQGLASQEINRAGLLADTRGQLWIGGVGGLSRYRPELDRSGAAAPLLSLEAIVQEDRVLAPGEPLELAHQRNDLAFAFHAISFADVGRVGYRFRLEGYDPDWIEDPRASEGGLVRYTNLPPGEYRFEVAARAGDGPWSASVSTARIEIAPPFWTRLWFQACVFAALAALAWGVNHVVLQGRRNAQLDRLVAERTEQLLAAERGHREAFEQSRAPQLLLERAGGTILAANDAAARFYGRPVEALVGATLADFEEPREDGARVDLREVSPGHGRRYESVQRQASGALREVELYASGYELAGQPTVQVILHDVTERRRLQEKLAVAQRMESIGLLAGGIAHDFNNILTVIQGNAELALAEIDPDDPSRAPLRAELEAIRESGQRAAGLTRQLLEFSRRRVVRCEPLDLNSIVRDLEPLARRLTRADIALELELDPALEPILAERSQMEQVVLNLVVNASEAMPQGGRIAIRTARVELSATSPGEPAGLCGRFARLEVSDTGVGMDALTAQRIFEPFFSSKPRGQGTGLGLATLHGIVEQSGGRVEVESEPGRGSTFRVWLPVAAGATVPEPRRNESAQRLRGSETVLLCEDDEAVRELAARVLAEHGYRVLPAALPSRALELAEDRSRPIDLLVTDVILPERNGRELADAVRLLRRDLPVLYVSGYTADVIARHGMLSADVELLHKPFRVPDLLARVRALLDRSRPASPAAGRVRSM